MTFFVGRDGAGWKAVVIVYVNGHEQKTTSPKKLSYEAAEQWGSAAHLTMLRSPGVTESKPK